MQELRKELKELFSSPGWGRYLDLVEGAMIQDFMSIFQLDPTKPESYIKFVELKGRIDQLRDLTYFIEREASDEPEEVEKIDQSYGVRFTRILKKLFGR